MKEKERRVASGSPLGIANMGLSLPGRCLFVSPRQGVKRERMKAARVEGQEQARWRMEGEVSPHWDGTTCVAFFAGRLCGHTKRC